jgi:choline transporter-like protein 2/4/5
MSSNPNTTVIQSSDTMEGQSVSQATLTSAVTALGAFLELRSFGERVFNDLSATWWMIGLAFLAATVVSFLWIVLMRFFAGIMVWTSIGLIFALFGGLFGYSLYK